MTLAALPHQLNRTVLIRAPRELVFGFFTDDERWASWWGAGSTIEPRVGGRIRIAMPGGAEVLGDVLDVASPERLVFTYGFSSGKPIPPGSSRVTITLTDVAGSTRLELTHEFGEPSPRDEHVQGWRYQLAVFGNLVANRLHANAAGTVDQWFATWGEPDAEARNSGLDRIASTSIQFRDQFSLIDGLDDLRPHLAAVHRFMPGMRITREGNVRHCQGTVLADWVARGSDGAERGRGTNVFSFGADGRVASVVGFWSRG